VTAYSSTDRAFKSLPGTRLPTFLWMNTSPGLIEKTASEISL
jgi:hypothetical protein